MIAYALFMALAAPVVDMMTGLAQVYTLLRPAKGFYVSQKQCKAIKPVCQCRVTNF